MARPSHWYFIKVPQSDFTLTITMASQLNIKNLLELHSGTKSALIYYLFARHSFPAITGVLALLCGIIIFFASLFIKTVHKTALVKYYNCYCWYLVYV